MLTKERKLKIMDGLKNMQCDTWVSFNKYTQEEVDYIIDIIQTARGSSLETDGESYKPETHTRFRKIDTSYRNNN